MKCTTCGEYIYKGRKFNARKETTDEKYYSIVIYRFYIRCTRCSGEITFKTDPKNMDYTCERGAKRNFEPWRQGGGGNAGDGKGGVVGDETEEEILDRLEQEEGQRDAMGELEGKVLDAKMEMKIADALDEIRVRNARNERVEKAEADITEVLDRRDLVAEERERVEKEIEEAARRAFMTESGEKVRRIVAEDGEDEDEYRVGPLLLGRGKVVEKSIAAAEKADRELMPPPGFKRGVKRKKDFGVALGIKKKVSLV